MSKKNALKAGEKILFTIVGVFVVLAMVGYIVLETVRTRSDKPLFEVKTHFDFSVAGERGSALFRKAGCTSCHRALRNGTNMGLSLDGIGSRRSKEWLLTFLKNPESTYESRTLDHGPAPKEAAYVAKLPEQHLQDIAVFLSELRADQGSASAPVPPAGRSVFIDDMVKMWAPKDWNEKYEDVRETEQQTGNDSK
jgi:cytochrome c553